VHLLTVIDLCQPSKHLLFSREELLTADPALRDPVLALESLGHQVSVMGLYNAGSRERRQIFDCQADALIDLTEALKNRRRLDFRATAFLEGLRIPMVSAPSQIVKLCRDKVQLSKLATAAGLRVPRVLRASQVTHDHCRQTLFVKPRSADASEGVSQRSRVRTLTQFKNQIIRLNDLGLNPMVQAFVPGREVTFAFNVFQSKLSALSAVELEFLSDRPDEEFFSEKLKWSPNQSHRFRQRPLRPSSPVVQQMKHACEMLCEHLKISSGLYRADFRVDRWGRLYFIELNPGPSLNRAHELAVGAASWGLKYNQLVREILVKPIENLLRLKTSTKGPEQCHKQKLRSPSTTAFPSPSELR
jgi:D-alanine-D-alanine ligase-like ATP-grasp enzyme